MLVGFVSLVYRPSRSFDTHRFGKQHGNASWSRNRELNPGHPPYRGGALPLSYSGNIEPTALS